MFAQDGVSSFQEFGATQFKQITPRLQVTPADQMSLPV